MAEMGRPRKLKRIQEPQLAPGWAPCPRCGQAVRVPRCSDCRDEQDPFGPFRDGDAG